jgi:sugar lactone lactonase YvrE
MRWLWKGWPQPVVAGASQNVFLKSILRPGEDWQSVANDDPTARTIALHSRGYSALGSDGRVYGTDPSLGTVWLRPKYGRRIVIDTGINGPTGIALSPDGLWLAVAESKTHWGYSYRIRPDGIVQDKQRFYWFHVPDEADNSGAGAWVLDREGRLYSATRLGVQVFDHNGRVRAILPIPSGEAKDLRFGDGEELDVLYVMGADGKTYRRRFNVPGVQPGDPPTKSPNWGPG